MMKRVLVVSESNFPKGTKFRLSFIDATDPFRLSSIFEMETHSLVVSLAYKDGLIYCSMSKGFSIYDVSDLNSVKEISHIDLFGGIDMELSSGGDYAYLTSWKRGITIVDIHDPYNPSLIGRASCNYQVLPDDDSP
ncbi:hypothetical protein Y697_05095 [Mesotoga sp. BH458_6_3_2_1]|nr:hypothetical protein Y697_05095 [Mesotoga sp. BH458_6_3_2_1]